MWFSNIRTSFSKSKLSLKDNWRQVFVYGMIREERRTFWKVIVPIIMRKRSHLNMCLILDRDRDRAVRNSLLHFCLWGWMKTEVYIRKVDTGDELLVRILVAAARIKTREDQLRRTTRDFACELQSARGLMVGFSHIYSNCNKFVI